MIERVENGRKKIRFQISWEYVLVYPASIDHYYDMGNSLSFRKRKIIQHAGTGNDSKRCSRENRKRHPLETYFRQFLRVLKGFLLALISALVLGVLIGLSRPIERFTELVIQLLKPIPPIAWIPLAILWFGIGESSKLYIIFYGAFFPILLNTVDGIHNIDKRYLELGCVYEVDRWRLVWKVILPGALPSIFTGVRVGLGNAWVCVVAAEMIAATRGIGYMLSNGRSMSRADDVILAMLLIGIVGKIMDDILRIIPKIIMKWN